MSGVDNNCYHHDFEVVNVIIYEKSEYLYLYTVVNGLISWILEWILDLFPNCASQSCMCGCYSKLISNN